MMLKLERRLKLRESGVASSTPAPRVSALKPTATERNGLTWNGCFSGMGGGTTRMYPLPPAGSPGEGALGSGASGEGAPIGVGAASAISLADGGASLGSGGAAASASSVAAAGELGCALVPQALTGGP